MLTVRPSAERLLTRGRKRDVWLTFDSEAQDSSARSFGALERFEEDRLRPGAALPSVPPHEAEIVTYVREGAVAHEDSTGRSGVIHAGEFQRMTSGRAVRHSEANASRTDTAHLFQIWLRPSAPGQEPGLEQKRFAAGERRGVLCLVASPDARKGSLRLHQDALVYSAMLDAGHHMVHELVGGRGAWLHIVAGEATLGDVVLSTGDAAGITADRAVSLTASTETEILLVDLAYDG